MKKKITIGCLIGSGFIIASTSGVFTALLMFLLVGQIPGTQTSLSPLQMGAFLSICAAMVMFYTNELRYRQFVKASFGQLKARLPKRRFTHI